MSSYGLNDLPWLTAVDNRSGQIVAISQRSPRSSRFCRRPGKLDDVQHLGKGIVGWGRGSDPPPPVVQTEWIALPALSSAEFCSVPQWDAQQTSVIASSSRACRETEAAYTETQFLRGWGGVARNKTAQEVLQRNLKLLQNAMPQIEAPSAVAALPGEALSSPFSGTWRSPEVQHQGSHKSLGSPGPPPDWLFQLLCEWTATTSHSTQSAQANKSKQLRKTKGENKNLILGRKRGETRAGPSAKGCPSCTMMNQFCSFHSQWRQVGRQRGAPPAFCCLMAPVGLMEELALG